MRALAWLLTAPPSLEASLSPLLAQPSDLFASAGPPDDYLHRLDADPARLHCLLATSSSRRLGHYAELLFYQYLLDHSDYCRHGIQLRDEGGRTVGEFDFLVQRCGRTEHWELASKFYLWPASEQAGSTASLYHFLGPNLNDCFGDKLDKMLNAQLRLGLRPEYATLNLPVVDAALAWIRGWMFYPPELAGNPPQLPGLAAGHNQGWMLTASAFLRLPDCRGRILPRLEWLAPARCEAGAVIGSSALHEAISAHFRQSAAPVLLAQMEVAGDSAYECARYMIVPDGWPDRALRLMQAMQTVGR